MMTFIADYKHGLALACLHAALMIYVTYPNIQAMGMDVRVVGLAVLIAAMCSGIVMMEKTFTDRWGTHRWSYLLYGMGLALTSLYAWAFTDGPIFSFLGLVVVFAAWGVGDFIARFPMTGKCRGTDCTDESAVAQK